MTQFYSHKTYTKPLKFHKTQITVNIRKVTKEFEFLRSSSCLLSLKFFKIQSRLIWNMSFYVIIWTEYVLRYIHIFKHSHKDHEKLEINPFVPNAPFFAPLKHQKILFLCFQGVEKRCIGNKWVNAFHSTQLFLYPLKT